MGGNSESMGNMMMGTNLVIKSLGCIQNGGLQQSLCKPEYIYVKIFAITTISIQFTFGLLLSILFITNA